MKRMLMAAVLATTLSGVVAGCDNSPPPPRVPVPSEGTIGPPRNDPARPLPGQVPQSVVQPSQLAPPQLIAPSVSVSPPPEVRQVQAARSGFDPRIAAPSAGQLAVGVPGQAPGTFDDQPIVRDRLPEQRAFIEAYNAVGRPRIAVFVNRRLDGSVVGVADAEDPTGRPVARLGVDPQRVSVAGPGNSPSLGTSAVVTPGQFDEAFVKAMDYEAVESVLTDWLSAGGNTELISPTLSRAKLTLEQQQRLERGEKGVLLEILERLDADILVQVQARPTRQTFRGLEIRLVAEAINTRGGRSVGRAVVDVPPPLEKRQINEYTRFVARKLMDDMIGAWSAPGPATQAVR